MFVVDRIACNLSSYCSLFFFLVNSCKISLSISCYPTLGHLEIDHATFCIWSFM